MGGKPSKPRVKRTISLGLPSNDTYPSGDECLVWRAMRASLPPAAAAKGWYVCFKAHAQHEPIFMARAAVAEGVLPAQAGMGGAYCDGALMRLPSGVTTSALFYEVLAGPAPGWQTKLVRWLPDTPPPAGACVCGRLPDGTPLFMGMAHVKQGEASFLACGGALPGACAAAWPGGSAVAGNVMVLTAHRTRPAPPMQGIYGAGPEAGSWGWRFERQGALLAAG
jgi:hypothetical protein